MEKLTKEEVVKIFDQFINERGLWFDFVEYLEGQGYEPADLGLSNE